MLRAFTKGCVEGSTWALHRKHERHVSNCGTQIITASVIQESSSAGMCSSWLMLPTSEMVVISEPSLPILKNFSDAYSLTIKFFTLYDLPTSTRSMFSSHKVILDTPDLSPTTISCFFCHLLCVLAQNTSTP